MTRPPRGKNRSQPTSAISATSDHGGQKQQQGQVIAAFGRQYLVEPCLSQTLIEPLDSLPAVLCVTRGKKTDVVVGDRVDYAMTGPGQGVIERIHERRSLLYRSDAFRTKSIAANVTQLILVTATDPSFSDELLTRSILAAEDQNIKVLIVLNKTDLTDRLASAEALLAPYEALGYPVLRLSALDPEHLRQQLAPHLYGHTSVLVGQSGMGKSTLTNALIPDAEAATREISTFLDSGKHTTTHARLYHLPPLEDDETPTEQARASGHLIDSPGLQAFALAHLDRASLDHGFIEFRPYLGQCRFRDCKHRSEPGCALQTALAEGQIHPRRFACYQSLLREAGL